MNHCHFLCPCVGSDWVAECAGWGPVTTPWVGPKGSTQRGVSSTDFGKSQRHFGLILQHRLDSGRLSCLVWVRVVWSVRDRPLEPRRHTQLGIKRLGWSSLFGSSICRGALLHLWIQVNLITFDHTLFHSIFYQATHGRSLFLITMQCKDYVHQC